MFENGIQTSTNDLLKSTEIYWKLLRSGRITNFFLKSRLDVCIQPYSIMWVDRKSGAVEKLILGACWVRIARSILESRKYERGHTGGGGRRIAMDCLLRKVTPLRSSFQRLFVMLDLHNRHGYCTYAPPHQLTQHPARPFSDLASRYNGTRER